ncbi:MAG: guanylate kinase [Capsulimonas sp.]|jgi:guanylate kinase|nr:guanylate kinase [Capsulimonas sp.]
MTVAKASSGLLVVVSGPSAVGKDTVLDILLMTPGGSHPVRKAVTVTTRAPRPKDGGRSMEENGVDYFFVSSAEFYEMVSRDEFLEYAEVHDSWYGTPRQWVEEQRQQGVDIILKIDVQGGLAVKKKLSDAVLIFLEPPSIEELERRLRGRKSESEDAIKKRLLNAHSELAQRDYYDYAVTNDTVPDAVEAIRAILLARHCRIQRPREPRLLVQIDE